MNNPQYPVARSTNLVVQEVPNEVLIFDIDTNKAHCLNKTAALVWKSCDGKRSVSEIAEFVGSETGEQVSDDLVWLAIDQLNETNLLEDQVTVDFKGQSRRDALKKIGLASVIALPIVASLAAPQNALANMSCGCITITDCNPLDGCPTNNCGQDVSGLCR
ncbi:MAG: PqqD family protein [Acidobacteria bacterium]|nr:PqqD family protein [Acidobacteriota bacterium]